MVRNYKRKTTDDNKYTKDDLELAINEARKSTIYRASEKFKIPYATLHSRIKGSRGVKKQEKGRPITIPIDDERRLANGLRISEKWGYGFSRKEVIEMVASFINKNNVKNNFKNGIPGEGWFIAFKKRHNLSIKTPQNVEYARKKALDPFLIYEYLDLLKITLDELGLSNKPHRIWNLDESSLSIDPRKVKVVGAVNKVSSRTVSSPGKENTTILLMCNAAGDKAPPLIIYKGINMWNQWLAPPELEFPGTCYAASKNGWMEADIFKNYFLKTVVPFVGAERPVLIIYDGHSTHVTLEVLEAAVKEKITILKLPPHSSHLLQPLDLAVFKSFKCKWDQKLVTWQRNHVGQKLPKKIFSQFLCDTWKSISPDVISNGFRKGGIFPYNRNTIPEEKFPPELLQKWKKSKTIATVTQDQTKTDNNSSSDSSSSCQPGPSSNSPLSNSNSPSSSNNSPSSSNNSPSSSNNSLPSNSNSPPSNSNSPLSICNSPPGPSRICQQHLSFEDLLLSAVKQTPKPPTQKKTRICHGAEILTSTQALDVLKEKQKPVKKNAKRKPQSFSSSSSNSRPKSPGFIALNNSEDKENNINENNLNRQELENIITPGCWALVRYSTKKLIKYFVGNVIEQNEEGWVVKFAKPYKNKFVWPTIEDVDTVDENDVIKVLPIPTIDRRGLLAFPVCFGAYNLSYNFVPSDNFL